jgi:uncharacterized protein YjbI with pentapeptide repeats
VAEGFTCEVEGARIGPPGDGVEPYLSACEGLGFYDEHEGKRYCVLHFPGEEKKDAFRKVLEDKLAQKDYDFGGAFFPKGTSDFHGAKFNDNVSFDGATFRGNADFMGASFSGWWTSFTGAQFSGEDASFWGVHFGGGWTSFAFTQFTSDLTQFKEAQFSSDVTDFIGAQFNSDGSDFTGTQFDSRMTRFSGARFGSTETYFWDATFTQEVVFHGATFREKVTFMGSKANPVFGSGAWARFNRCRIVKPEQFTFNTVLLHPGWFCNTDVRKVDFTDVKWYGMPGGPEGTLDEEIKETEKRDVEPPHTLIAQACRRLSANAEENHEYPLANEFHYWSMDALRIGSWSVIYEALLKEEVRQHIKEEEQRDITFKDLKPKALDVRALLRKDTRDHIRGRRRFGVVNSLYWGLCGYGVRAGRALGVLVTIAVVFAVLYMIVGHPSLEVLPIEGIWQVLADAGRAVMYSLGVMARLRPEPIPKEMGPFQILVTVEGILGPLQIALLALAIRRKVMR